MKIDRVWTTNWMRFGGDNTVDLASDVYGLVGRYDGDARRSNWAGKTSFIEAIRFALFGVHRAAREDGWITEGATGGSVSVTLSDGTLITRSRRRGQATKLMVTRAGEQSTGDAAQEVIERAIGLNKDDFEVTCWFGQKQMARLILARPVDRFELVSGWFGLAPLQRCEERAREHLSTVGREAARVRALLDSANARLGLAVETGRRIVQDAAVQGAHDSAFGLVWPADAIREMLNELGPSAQLRERAAAENRQHELARVEEFADARRKLDAANELADVRTKGTLLTEQIAALGKEVTAIGLTKEEAQDRYNETRLNLSLAADDLKAKRSLARGEFSGTCPVDNGACPAKNDINKRSVANAALYEKAVAVYDERSRQESVDRIALAELDALFKKMDAKSAERDALRQRARELIVKAEGAVELDENEHAKRVEAYEKAFAEHTDAVSDAEIIKQTIGRLDSSLAEIAQHEKVLAELRAQEETGRAALRIFGRQGAQRQIAEGALIEIELEANDILRSAGVDLSVQVLWAREGVGLAAWCGECGAPFPSSTRVKRCERCNAERGPKVIERLDIELSDRSGAAEDLAGVALQLAGAAWLRRERGVQWSVAFLDEPFGSLDEANRKGFSAHLSSMLRGSAGFEQAFIVAHHPDVIDGLPARLVVSAGEKISTVEAA